MTNEENMKTCIEMKDRIVSWKDEISDNKISEGKINRSKIKNGPLRDVNINKDSIVVLFLCMYCVRAMLRTYMNVN